jgi:hypothetical protein
MEFSKTQCRDSRSTTFCLVVTAFIFAVFNTLVEYTLTEDLRGFTCSYQSNSLKYGGGQDLFLPDSSVLYSLLSNISNSESDRQL